jgi:hypothetical protein
VLIASGSVHLPYYRWKLRWRYREAAGFDARLEANQGENPVTVQKYLTTSQLVLGNVVLDSRKKLGEQLGSTALPTTLFFDASGRLLDTPVQ